MAALLQAQEYGNALAVQSHVNSELLLSRYGEGSNIMESEIKYDAERRGQSGKERNELRVERKHRNATSFFLI
jgi:hypothetical protein